MLINRRWQSNRLDVRSFKGADCDPDQFLVVSKVTEILATSKQAGQKFDVDRFNLRELSEPEVRKQYQIKISNRFAVLQNVNDSEDTHRALKTLKIISKPQLKCLGLYERKQHKPWPDEECSRFSDPRK